MAPGRGTIMDMTLQAPLRRGLAAAVAAVALLGGVCSQPDAAMMDNLAPEQLAQLIAHELQTEEKRPSEKLLSFHEFQDIGEYDCNARLFYLFNQTLNLREQIVSFHTDVLGVAGLFMPLLKVAPGENSWVWLLTTSQERILAKIHTYFSRVVALSLDKHPCMVAEVRNVLLHAVVRWKELYQQHVSLTWNGFAFGTYGHDMDQKQKGMEDLLRSNWEDSFMSANMWFSTVREWFEKFNVEMYNALRLVEDQQIQITGDGATRLHHQDEKGSFVSYESLRRRMFKQWALDKGLLRGLIRHVWQPPYGSVEPLTVGDFGAGGGQYSAWLNETGLVRGHAFDGTHQPKESVVSEINLVEEFHLWRKFDWVMCLEVGEHIPKQYSSALLQNLRAHATKGLVMSWSDDWEGIGHVNCIPRQDFVDKVQKETGLVYDAKATELVQASCDIEYIARTIAVFRATGRSEL